MQFFGGIPVAWEIAMTLDRVHPREEYTFMTLTGLPRTRRELVHPITGPPSYHRPKFAVQAANGRLLCRQHNSRA